MPRFSKTEFYATLWRLVDSSQTEEFLRLCETHIDKLAEGFLHYDAAAQEVHSTHLLHELAWQGRATLVDRLCGVFRKHGICPSELLDEQGNNVTHYAVAGMEKKKALPVMDVLDQHKVGDALPNIFGTTPFAEACAAQNRAIVDRYIDGAEKSDDIRAMLLTQNYFGHNALQHSLWSTSPDVEHGRKLYVPMTQHLLEHADAFDVMEPLLADVNMRGYNALDSIAWMKRRLEALFSAATLTGMRTTLGRELAASRSIEQSFREAGAEHGALWRRQERTPGALEAYNANHWQLYEDMMDRLSQERYAAAQLQRFAARHYDDPAMRMAQGR